MSGSAPSPRMGRPPELRDPVRLEAQVERAHRDALDQLREEHGLRSRGEALRRVLDRWVESRP